jgi:hypothetical protein
MKQLQGIKGHGQEYYFKSKNSKNKELEGIGVNSKFLAAVPVLQSVGALAGGYQVTLTKATPSSFLLRLL